MNRKLLAAREMVCQARHRAVRRRRLYCRTRTSTQRFSACLRREAKAAFNRWLNELSDDRTTAVNVPPHKVIDGITAPFRMSSHPT
jgi:hypothetical protein